MKYTWLDLVRQFHVEDMGCGEAKGNPLVEGGVHAYLLF